MTGQCTHKREGIVTTHPGRDYVEGPHAARDVCSRPACIIDALRWARDRTGIEAVWVPDPTRNRP